jgi:DNA polymerase/3'-5' exonuclease PolX
MAPVASAASASAGADLSNDRGTFGVPTDETPAVPVHRRIDVRFFPLNCYWTGVCYFTGDQHLNVELRRIALEKHMTLSEYCICNEEGKPLPVTCEEDIFRHLGVEFKLPCHRSTLT